MTIGVMKLLLGTILIDQQDYWGKIEREKILKKWNKIIKGRQERFAIHYTPKLGLRWNGSQKPEISLHVPLIKRIIEISGRPEPCNQIQKNMCRKLSEQQEQLIRDNLFGMPIKELAEKADVDVKVIYNRRRNFSASFPIPDKKKVIIRPPAIYSNKNYELL